MAVTYKVLGQAAPSTTSNVDLYTVPTATSTVVSTLTITNVNGAASLCRVYVRQSGATAAASNALVYDAYIQANDFNPITVGLTLAATDIITVQTGTANALTFQLFGSEITA
jgi:hypothetical protein